MPSGILIIDKPAGWTSMDVCAKLRGAFHERRVGHAGTLDPMATGVLPVFVGRATRAVEFAGEGDKEYLAGLRLGTVTKTQDTTGEVLEERPPASREALEGVLDAFRGELEQVPPMYSAVKIGGKKLYELARKGREVERAPRRVTIRRLELLEGPSGPEGRDYLLRVGCSKGTYVRTLCHDIGQALGCGGCMCSLRRTMAAGFTLDQAVGLGQVLASEDPASLLLPVDAYFAGRPRRALSPAEEKKVRNGAPLPAPGIPEGEYLLYSQSGEFLALSRAEKGRLVTIKSFFAV